MAEIAVHFETGKAVNTGRQARGFAESHSNSRNANDPLVKWYNNGGNHGSFRDREGG